MITPNIKQGRIVIPGMITLEDMEDRKQDWGEDTAMYIGSVLGQFSENPDEMVVPLSIAKAAVERELEPEGEVIVACDVARKGHDNTVVMRRQGGVARIVRRVRGYDTMEVSGILKSYCDANRVDVLVIDDVGIGGGVTDRVREVVACHCAHRGLQRGQHRQARRPIQQPECGGLVGDARILL